MSDQLRLAKLLAQQPIPKLAAIMSDASLQGRAIGDLLELAGYLLQRKQLASRIESLHRDEIAILVTGGTTDGLRACLVADEAGSLDAASQLAFKLLAEMTVNNEIPVLDEIEDVPPQLVAQSIGQSMIALRELILSSERHWLRVMKQGLRKPDAVMFSEYIHFTTEEIQQLFSLATALGMIQQEHERWVASAEGLSWASKPDQEAWVELLQNVDAHLQQLAGIGPGDDLSAFLTKHFPLLPVEKNLVARHGRLLGLAAEGRATPILVRIISGQMTSVLSELGAVWPQPTQKIIVQADQSITIAGPVSGEMHLEFSTFADAIDIGLASRFRLNKPSLSRGLETGLTAAEIDERLRGLSGGDLPQPVQYLLQDAERSLLNIKVQASAFGSVIDFVDRVDSLQLERDRALSPLNLFRTSEHQLASRLKRDIVWLAIRDAGYVAVRVDSAGDLLRLEPEPTSNPLEAADQFLSLAEALLKTGTPELDEQNLIKRLQFAQKNRLPVQMTVRLASGSELSFAAIVTGVSETRVRVRDAVADTERTLPLTSILNWELG